MSRFPAYPRHSRSAERVLGRQLFGGRKESFPQLRLVSAGLDQPAQPTPFLVFNIAFVVSLPLRISVLQDNGGAHPLVMDALAEMSEAQIHRAYPSVCEYAHALPTRARTKGTPFKIYL